MRKLFIILITLFTCIATSLAQKNWGKIDHKGQPWVKNISRPYSITKGLEGRHLALWASHGIFYDIKKHCLDV